VETACCANLDAAGRLAKHRGSGHRVQRNVGDPGRVETGGFHRLTPRNQRRQIGARTAALSHHESQSHPFLLCIKALMIIQSRPIFGTIELG
jgi:hypothetical protein